MNEWIRMANRKKLNDTYIVDLGDHITVHSASLHTVQEAWEIFGDPKKTMRIRSSQYGDEAVWTGYTLPVAILTEGDGVAVSLMKEGND